MAAAVATGPGATAAAVAAAAAAAAAGAAAAAAAPAVTLAPPGALPAATAASLYVGDLEESVTETQLFELFAQMGSVSSIRVCRDAVTRRSLGYAYVNYASTADAARALEALNYSPLNGRSMRIMWSHRDPSARKSGVGNIFIKNLDECIDNKALHDTFSAFGNILSCKIALQDGKSKGYGFVHFETNEAANLAIDKVNGMLLEGKKVYVGKFLKRSERIGQDADTKFTNVFIKNLDQELSEESLRQTFSAFGPMANLVVMKDENDRSRGFGFVNYEDPEDARNAVEKLNGTLLGSKSVYVGRAQKKAEREQILRREFEERRLEQIQKYQGANLYVKNLDDTVDDDSLQQEFSHFGNITSAKVMRDERGVSRGFGFVCFSSPDEAARAAAETNGFMVRGKPIYVALAQRKDVRQAQLQQHYAQRIGLMPAPGAVAYPPVYYAPQAAILPQVQQRQGMVYQPVMRPWRAGPLTGPPGRPGLQPLPPYALVPNAHAQRQQRQVRNRAPVPQPGQPLAQLPHMPAMQPGFKDTARGQQRPRQAVKYVSNVRGRDGGPGVSQQPQLMNSAPVLVPSGTDVLSMMASASPREQKQFLGERIYPLVQAQQSELAGKITGMLLEMDITELLLLLESPEALTSKVDEAVQVLQQHSKTSVPEDPSAAANGIVADGEA